MDQSELDYLKQISWFLTSNELSDQALKQFKVEALAPPPPCAPRITHTPSPVPRAVSWAGTDIIPIESPLEATPSDQDPLPKADWLIITWTVDEVTALARVFTPSRRPGDKDADSKWYHYARNFSSYIPDLPESTPYRTHPAIAAQRLGRYYLTRVGSQTALLFKSELHLNQDGSVALKEGRPLPLQRLIKQIVQEVEPKFLVSAGTAGGTLDNHFVGDTVVSTSGLFRCGDPRDFCYAEFNCKQFGIDYWVDNHLMDRAQALSLTISEPDIELPHSGYASAGRFTAAPRIPTIHEFPQTPILTTDFFEFGTTTNQLGNSGCAIEMGDALLAMTLDKSLRYVFVRNISDPMINGNIDRRLQIMWALYYYQNFGLATSFNGALVVWAIIAGQQDG